MAVSTTETDPRLTAILDHIQKLKAGDFTPRGNPEEAGDELDGITHGLNMLAEVLESKNREHEALLASLRRNEERVRALSESEARWQSLVDNAPDYIMILDPQLRVTFVNQAPPGFSTADVVGTRVTDTVEEAGREVLERELKAALETGRPRRFEMRGLGPQAGAPWYSVQVSPLFQSGSIRQLVVIGRDIIVLHDMFQVLDASEARYRHLWENLNDAAVIADAKTGYIIETNAKAERLLGLPRERIIGMRQAALHPREKLAQYAERFRRQMEQGGTIYDVEVVRADGTVVHVDISAATMELDGQHLILGLFHDITHRKKMMRELEFMNFAVEHATDAVFWMDSDLRFVHVNKEACRRLGFTREEFSELSIPDIVPDVTPEARDTYLRQLREQASMTRRTRHRCKDGSLFPVEVSINYFRFDGEEYFCSIARDITEREEAESAILERDANLQALADNANDGISVRIGTHYAFVNRRFAMMLGYPSTDALLSVAVVDLVEPSERKRITAYMKRRRTNKESPSQYETLLLCHDGSPLPVEITVAETIWSGREADLIIIRDITTRKTFEQALSEKAAALQAKSNETEQVNRELQQLIYVMAHDLKAPLRAVSQLATVFAQESAERLEGEPLRLLDLMQGRVKRMHALIEALLTYSRAGERDSSEEVDVKALVIDVVNSLPLPEQFVVTIGDMPRLRTERIQLRQVFANLIGNGIEHHDRLDGCMEVKCARQDEGYEFTVTDDGPGIPPEYHDLIFEMFQNLQPRDRKEQAGVGLTLAKKVVEGLGGSITVESGQGRGSTFRFYWPDGA